MIETTQTVTIKAPLETVWNHARHIEGWAALMPGMQSCDIIDENNSRWVLKVGVGGMVRTVTVNVTVNRWDGPCNVDFAYALVGDPVKGGGSYRAIAVDPVTTEVALQVQVEGSGPLAPMWEAMGRPLLPQLAKGFAGELREAIERDIGSASVASGKQSLVARLLAALRRLLGRCG